MIDVVSVKRDVIDSCEIVSNIMEFQTSSIQPNTFTWSINKVYVFHGKCVSNFFQFCAYPCHLMFEAIGSYTGSGIVTISLHGYPKPYIENLCHYSLILKDNLGRVLGVKSGKVQVDEESRIVLYKGSLSLCKTYPVIDISWYEIKEISCQMKSTQAESGMSSSGVECATQTEDYHFPYTRNISSNVDSSTNNERSTQTEVASLSYEGDVGSSKDGETYKFLEILSNEFGRFYESKTDPDCILRVSEAKFQVHRSILAARSTVFEAMFHHDTAESQSGEVNIQDVDAHTLDDVLYYIYTAKIRGLSADTATSMYVTADKYALVDLRVKCLDFLMCNLTVENICDAALLAHTHAEMKLEDKVIEFVEERLNDLEDNEGWKTFADTHYKIANKLLFSALKSSKEKKSK